MRITGRLFNDPALVAGQGGSTSQIMTSTQSATAPITAKASCQPKSCPSLVPIGSPITVATIVPPITHASPSARFPFGAMRAAKGVMMDQKMEWHRATQMRAAKSDPKLATQSTAMWLKAKQRIRHKRSFRRSNRAVRIVKGSDMMATTQA